jgi:hypothetical protein
MEVPEDLGRKLRRLLQSLTLWKNRAATKQGQILYLRVRVRDLHASRNYWKQRALAAESSPPTPSFEPTLPPPALEPTLPPPALEPTLPTTLEPTLPPAALEPASLPLPMESVLGEC